MNDSAFIQFLADPNWDTPFFKRLAQNDTGAAPGHQGGVVVPKDLREFFPDLDESLATAVNPTQDKRIVAEMYLAEKRLGMGLIRYQFQTWGGTRSAESRLTDNLGSIRNRARGGDFLLIQRAIDRLGVYRLILVPQGFPQFSLVLNLAGTRRWGALYSEKPPISHSEIVAARAAMLVETQTPFEPVRENVPRKTVSRAAIARDTAFRETLLSQYDRKCAVSGISLTSRAAVEVQAAHVVALADGGADEPRNGFTLTGTLHWAFDQGLFMVGDDRRVFVPSPVRAMRENQWLSQFHERLIAEAKSVELRTAGEAFAFHRNKFCSMWS